MRRYHEHRDDGQFDRDLDAVETDITRLTAQLAAEKAWSACLDRTTAEQVQALHSYRDHVASISTGRCARSAIGPRRVRPCRSRRGRCRRG